MSNSKIEWTEKVWNPVTGCNKVSAGCKNCYAEVMHKRLMVLKPEKYSKPFLDGAVPYPDDLLLPLKWKKPAMVFVNSMSDLFHEDVPFEFIRQVFETMEKSAHHTFQILTKRPKRMLEFFKWICTGDDMSFESFNCLKVLPNVWLGVSVEDQAAADERLPLLMQVPAAVRWLSCEPLLGSIHLNMVYDELNVTWNDINWVVAGGESGHKARPMHPDWVRSLRNQCREAGVPFFFKQWGEWHPNFQQCSDFPGPKLDDPMEYFPNMEGYDVALNKHLDYWSNPSRITKIGDLDFNRYGKKNSGRNLDGREWNEMPATTCLA